jgi:hypothetical protein
MSAYRQNFTPAPLPRHAFAPGTIQRPAVYSHAHQRRVLRHWLKRAAVLLLATVCLLWALGAQAQTADAADTNASPWAPTAMGLHIGSHHFTPRDPAQGTWNNTNPGLYARWGSGLVLGTLRNSESRQSVYIGHIWQTPRWHGLAADATLGVINGYGRPVSPLAAVGASLAVSPRTTVRLSLLPKAAPKGSGAAHLSIEWSL